MSDRNASASAFGWDFQANSAILLMLENIKDAKRIRVEGADEAVSLVNDLVAHGTTLRETRAAIPSDTPRYPQPGRPRGPPRREGP